MNYFKKILEQVETANRHRRFIQENDFILAAVSGGPDSMALLEILAVLRKKYSLRLSVAHLDHQLQRNSAKTAALVRERCESLSVPFYSQASDIRKIAKHQSLSLEEAGRNERYRFFEKIAKKIHAKKIATAHTMDDQAETVLLHLFRGSGIKGLAGIRYERPHHNFRLIRPLLGCRKKDLVSLLKQHDLRYSVDPSNRNKIFTRNRIRHGLLPYIKKHFNPNIEESLTGCSDLLQAAWELLDKEVVRAQKTCLVRRSAGRILIKQKPFQRLSPEIQGEVLLRSFYALSQRNSGFGRAHVTMAMHVLTSQQPNARTTLPHGIQASKEREGLSLKARA